MTKKVKSKKATKVKKTTKTKKTVKKKAKKEVVKRDKNSEVSTQTEPNMNKIQPFVVDEHDLEDEEVDDLSDPDAEYNYEDDYEDDVDTEDHENYY